MRWRALTPAAGEEHQAAVSEAKYLQAGAAWVAHRLELWSVEMWTDISLSCPPPSFICPAGGTEDPAPTLGVLPD